MQIQSACAQTGLSSSLCLLGTLLTLACPVAAEYRTPAMPPETLLSQLQREHPPLVIDLRSAAEFRVGHVPGARNIQPEQLDQHLDTLMTSRTTVLYCIIGKRTREAEQRLLDWQVPNLYHLDGGFGRWIRSGNPVEK